MRFRTVALALALACGIGTIAEAKKKNPPNSRAAKVAKRKYPKSRKAPKRPKPNHTKHA